MKTTRWSAESESLPTSQFVARITDQYGPYKGINEDILREELSKAPANLEQPSASWSDDEVKLNGNANDGNPEALEKLKSDALADVLRAQSDAAYGRDFVSYLLARNANVKNQAHLTISPEVKEQVPPASLGHEVVQLEAGDEDQRLRSRLASGGIELGAFRSAVDSIVAAAERLEKEMRLETKYWQDITKVGGQSWSVCRMPQQRQCLAVRVGCMESGIAYRGKGLVKLQRSKTGAVELNLSGDVAKGRRIRARLQHKAVILASFSPYTATEPGEDKLQYDLLRARDSLFDEEIFYELSREAGQLWNHGIKFTDMGIVVPLVDEIDLILDLIEPGHTPDPSASGAESSHAAYLQWPEASITAVRILFCHAHREMKNRRAAIPRPINGKQMTDGVPRLLLPFILRAQNQAASEEIGGFVHDIKHLLSKAEVDVAVHNSTNSQQVTELFMTRAKTGDRSFVERLIAVLASPVHSSYELTFGALPVKVCAMFRTHSGGSEYRYHISERLAGDSLAQMPLTMVFQSAEELKEAFTDIVRILLVIIIRDRSKGVWYSSTPQTGELEMAGGGQSEMLRISVSQTALLAEIFDQLQSDFKPSKILKVEADMENSIDLLASLTSRP